MPVWSWVVGMGTKLIVYVLLFDVFLSLMVGAYSGITPPSIPPEPSYSLAQEIASSIVWTVGWGPLTLWGPVTLIPPFSILGANFPGLTLPGLTIPGVTLFSISFSWLAPILYLANWIVWIFQVISSVVGYLFSIFTSSISLLANVPTVGPFLTAFTLIINFILIWELVKLIRGYGL
ncbi:Fuselloviral protein SSV2p28 [Saccharolobus solfataricus]|uniref:Fuselloviral protein SSV2p28 n=1 Tax=Saccharolobus solfataricus TaxID=2287 RepID=A0A157SYJ1_SACSO|nr:Fuselloviral protein SSV2p28 [Saccharolobus solfataricus]